jgi:hypothetical protein
MVPITRPAELPDLLVTTLNRIAQLRFKFIQELIQPVEGLCLLQYIPFRPWHDPSKRILGQFIEIVSVHLPVPENIEGDQFPAVKNSKTVAVLTTAKIVSWMSP